MCAELLWRKIKCIIFYIIVLSETEHALDIILYERPRLTYVILPIVADDLATQWARSSTAIVLTYLTLNNPRTAWEGLNPYFMWNLFEAIPPSVIKYFSSIFWQCIRWWPYRRGHDTVFGTVQCINIDCHKLRASCHHDTLGPATINQQK